MDKGRCLIGVVMLALAGCTSQTRSVDRPEGLASTGSFTPAAGEPGAWTYFAPGADLASYRSFIIEQSRVWRGEGSGFGDVTDADVQAIAAMFPDELRKALAPRYTLASRPGPSVARLRFTLIGVKPTVPYVSTATRIIPIGAAINLLSSGAGAGGTLTGSVIYGVEAFDSRTDERLAAAIRELTPGAFGLNSTLGTSETARAIARDAAAKIRARLDEMHPS